MSRATHLPRCFVTPGAGGARITFRTGQAVALSVSEAHHAAHVLRLKAGDAVELFDGCGAAAAARIGRVGRGEVTAVVEAVGPPAARPVPQIHLAFAVPKGRRLTWLLEKATELGVASLVPVQFEHSVAGARGLSAAARERWLAHCIAAAKQARLLFLPALEAPCVVEAFLASPRRGVFGDLTDEALPLAKAVGACASEAALYIMVGPEGGLTEGERRAARAAGLVPARLGRTTLRIETAAVALVAAATALLGT